MVIAELNGGLGNQLFQYATGLATALRKNTKLKLDIGNYQGVNCHHPQSKYYRTYALDKWNVDAHFATGFEVKALKSYHRIVARVRPHTPYFALPLVMEQHACFDPALFKVSRHCILAGCWQSEKYFIDIEYRLRREFTPRLPLSAHADAMAKLIGQTEQSVFLHVRRGDHLLSETLEAYTLDYYQKAISYVEQHVHQPWFFLFSDEPEWARRHLAVHDRFTLVTRPELPNDSSTGYEHEDVWLMSLCRHGIISNSTFGWWGAWLNSAKERIVVAPAGWKKKPVYDSRTFIPERWVRIGG
jgi:hypothetical protein